MIPVPEKRIADFEKMGFGMFIHYGLYSQLGRGEWVMYSAKMTREEYTPLADTFTAKDFDAKKIARLAKKSGMNYITITTRHHDGFSLYDTKGLSTFDAPHACGRDLIREFVDACNEEGIMPMFYHTTIDWHEESYEKDFKGTYLKYLQDSVEVLCTQYGKIGGLWFDGNWARPASDWDEDGLYATIRKHQPDALIINNTGLDARGKAGHPELDSVTYEQGRPNPMDRDGMPKYLAAEMCNTFNDHWGYGFGDFHYKSLTEMIETLCACRKVGANYLLNVGPDGDGNIVPLQSSILEAMGDWTRIVGDSIYNAKPSDIKGEFKNFALEDSGKAYLFVHDLGIMGSANVVANGGGVGYKYFKNIKGKVKSVKWTDNGETLDFCQKDDNLWFNATGFPYGCNYVVRIAQVDFE